MTCDQITEINFGCGCKAECVDESGVVWKLTHCGCECVRLGNSKQETATERLAKLGAQE